MRLTDIRDALMTDGTAVGVPGNRHLALYADDVHLWISGQTWPLAGHHTGRAALQVLMQAHDRLWPGGTHFSGNEYWWGGDSAVVHWFGRSRTWKGDYCHNSGMTIFHIDNDRISEVRVYSDSEFLANMTCGWREAVGEDIARRLPAFPFREASYPDPINDHTWGFDTATRDGRHLCPRAMVPMREQYFELLRVEGFSTGERLDNAEHKSSINAFMDNGVNLITFQGRSTPLGGRTFASRDGDYAIWLRLLRSIWPVPSYFGKVLFWFNESGMAFEWFSHSHTFKEQRTRNSGLTHVKWRDGKVFEYTEYTDTEFFSVVHSGWQEAFGDQCKDFPNYPALGTLATADLWAHF